MAYLHQAAAQLATTDWAVALWLSKVDHYRPLIEHLIAQTERRVLAGEPVPAGDKLVSLFEPHADIIRKGREVAYGHKLNLTIGQSGLILDLVIEVGNPADSERLLPNHTDGLDNPVRRMISAVPAPIRAQQHHPRPPDVLLRAVSIGDDRCRTPTREGTLSSQTTH